MHRAPCFRYCPAPEIENLATRRVPVVIVGAGLIGLAVACDLAQRGVASVVLEAREAPIEGSRAIVFAQRSLEILGRLGIGSQVREKGVTWNVGRVFHQAREVFSFDFRPESGFEWPPFVNIQQSYLEQWLAQACENSGLVDLRSRHRVTAVDSHIEGATVAIDTPDGEYRLDCDWLLACDGARSQVRTALDLPLIGEAFPDRFLIVDIEMENSEFPAERRFWFDPPFHPRRSVLLHKQPDHLWRVDFQLGGEADPAIEREPARVERRLRAMFGESVSFRIDWISIYTFRCRRLARFVHSRVVFAGDSAHELSPFGGRGGNGGLQDVDNLGWRIAAVLKHGAKPSLIESYSDERMVAADENILNSTRSARFISPDSPAVAALQRAALALARTTMVGRSLVNSGRLSRPSILSNVGQFVAAPALERALPPGAPAVDAPVRYGGKDVWLLAQLGGLGYALLVYGSADDCVLDAYGAVPGHHPFTVVVVSPSPPAPGSTGRVVLWDYAGLVARRYGLARGNALLLRPDQHVLGVFERIDAPPLLSMLHQTVGLQPVAAISTVSL